MSETSAENEAQLQRDAYLLRRIASLEKLVDSLKGRIVRLETREAMQRNA